MSTHSISPQQDQQRQDQIVHRFYIKTVEVLIEARLANVNGGDATERKVSVQTEDGHLVGATSPVSKSKKELRIDKWVSRFERYPKLNGTLIDTVLLLATVQPALTGPRDIPTRSRSVPFALALLPCNNICTLCHRPASPHCLHIGCLGFASKTRTSLSEKQGS
jgi:hypothetical protein